MNVKPTKYGKLVRAIQMAHPEGHEIQTLEQALDAVVFLHKEYLEHIHHDCRQPRVDFVEEDGTERTIVYEEGDASVGIGDGYCSDDTKWEDMIERSKQEGRAEERIENTTIQTLLKALKDAKWLYDEMALSSLQAAAKYGPDYEPPSKKQCLDIRGNMEKAIELVEPKEKVKQ